MGAVDVGVGHDDHAVVAQLLEVELVADPRADRGDHRLDLEVREHLVDPVLLRVDHLAAQRQDRLEGAVARVDRRAAGRVALDQVELGRLGIADRAVGELAGQRHAVERALPASQLARLAGGLPRVSRRERLLHDLLGLARVLLEELGELRVHGLLDEVLTQAFPSFVFVWPSNCGSWSLTEITAASPSRTSSPSRLSSFSFRNPFLRA